ncbi:MAG: CPBP family intramembrane metalloprotease [Solirubrobacterales bacterium]|nr:CPBP family intramembrane metalloprotease [Solirubrobacterales bacterium]
MSIAATATVGPGGGVPMEGRPYVSLGPRFVAAVIDNSFWAFAFFWVAALIPGSAFEDPAAAGVIVLIWLSLWFNYFAFCEWRWGQTIGKNAIGLRVVGVDGEKLAFGPSSVRNVLRLIDFFVIGWVMIPATERHQRLGDKAASSVVVREPRRAAVHRASGPSARAPEPPPPPPPASAAAGDEPSPGKKGGERRLPITPWDLGDTIWGLVGGLLLAIIVAPALVLPFDHDLSSLGAILSAQALLELSLFTVAVGVASAWRFRPPAPALERLGLRPFKRSALGWALLALFGYYAAAAIFAALVLQPKQEDIGGELGLDNGSFAAAALAVVLIALVAPFVEELFFRGFVFGGFRSRLSLWPAVLISGLIFGMIHASTGITTVIPLAALGCVLAWVYDKTGSLWPCIFIHVINNGLALALVG